MAEAQAALVLIDCQRAFLPGGCWASHFPPSEVLPICRAFESCSALLSRGLPPGVALALTQCPFWRPSDRALDPRIASLAPAGTPVFAKPDNDILELGDFAPWVRARGLRAVVFGGCTTNSCVRVSAVRTKRELPGLAVRVALDLCGARAANYLPQPHTGGVPPVAAAVEEMRAAGVEVIERSGEDMFAV
eukprot:m51a1_g2898 hypothetical protein (190) ;mRNA; f:463293-463862